ncbi:SpoIIE family protein phosphatase [Cesiribacter sp. SM1]|uniref:SpoIIE family protein phosphatase n=1 Tax=Cesiribacter sp. SM1 TaxID=2861196 RepID=UPI001CD61B0D|nr:SpoIIE family protein phosphatase [Cesiribacter sp. SM1]
MEQPLQSSAGNGSSFTHTRYRIEDRSYLSLIKKEIAKEAESLGFSAERIGRLDIIVAELASNLLKFGQRKRELLWKPFYHNKEAGVEIIALDGGGGITNMGLALQDGYSTSGTAGEGLGAIKRLSDTFDIYSQPGVGTAVLSRLFTKELPLWFDKTPTIAAVSVPKPGEKLCGDGYYFEYEPTEQLLRILVLDGLGHGPDAHLAAEAAIAAYLKVVQPDQAQVLKLIHQEIKKTRGAVSMALQFNLKEKLLRYCGVGNISGKLLGPDGTARALMSYNGIVGHTISSRIHDQELSWERGKLLVLHSDGITSRWDLSKYQQIQKHDLSLIAACLYRDHSRGTDDVTVVVSKHPETDGGQGTKANH